MAVIELDTSDYVGQDLTSFDRLQMLRILVFLLFCLDLELTRLDR